MNSKEALDTIKESETKAQEIIQQAKNEAQKIILDAHLEKERLIQNAQGRGRLDGQKLRAQTQGETLREIDMIKNKSQVEIAALKEKAQVDFERAVEFLKDNLKTKY